MSRSATLVLWSVGWPLIRELATVDYLIIGSDSGNLAIVEFHLTPSPRFEVLHKEPYGKSGARRMVPGQWLGVDPRGRSIMLGA